MPCVSTGMIWPFSLWGDSVVPSSTGILNPYISASNNPTFLPCCAKAIARFAETVDFPTPPLPLAIAKNFVSLASESMLSLAWKMRSITAAGRYSSSIFISFTPNWVRSSSIL